MGNVVKGYARTGSAVVNTDTTKLDLIKQKRTQKKQQDQVQSELGRLRSLVLDLMKRVEELERRG